MQAKKVLTNLGELEDTNRPLLTLSPAQLRALLEGQGIDVSGAVAAETEVGATCWLGPAARPAGGAGHRREGGGCCLN